MLRLCYKDALLPLEDLRVISPGSLLDLDELVVLRFVIICHVLVVLQAVLVEELALNLVVLDVVAYLLVDLVVTAS